MACGMAAVARRRTLTSSRRETSAKTLRDERAHQHEPAADHLQGRARFVENDDSKYRVTTTCSWITGAVRFTPAS